VRRICLSRNSLADTKHDTRCQITTEDVNIGNDTGNKRKESQEPWVGDEERSWPQISSVSDRLGEHGERRFSEMQQRAGQPR
jgi:hypothetical protein